MSSGTAGLLVTATQFGYVAGLLFIVPLGDLLQRRKLVSRLLLIDAVALAGAAAAPTVGVLAAALARASGVTSVAAQVLVPFASALARGGRARARGRAGDERAAARHPARAHGQPASWPRSAAGG